MAPALTVAGRVHLANAFYRTPLATPLRWHVDLAAASPFVGRLSKKAWPWISKPEDQPATPLKSETSDKCRHKRRSVGYLDRPRAQFDHYRQGGGSSPMVYALANRVRSS